MTIVFNLLCKAFIAILDILLLNFYLKNIYPDIYQERFRKVKLYIYSFIFISMLFNNNIIMYILIHLAIFIILQITATFFISIK